MPTPISAKRRQPERGAKSQAAMQHMNTQKPKNGMLGATPNSYYLAIAKRNAEESDILRLPPEIRNRIWGYVVSVDRVYIGNYLLSVFSSEIEEYPDLSVLQVCRQVHAETCLLLYSLNDFMLDNSYPSILRWKDLLPEQSAVIRKITVICVAYHEIPLRRLHGLKSMRVICFCHDRAHLKNTAEGQSVIDILKETLGNDGLKFIVED